MPYKLDAPVELDPNYEEFTICAKHSIVTPSVEIDFSQLPQHQRTVVHSFLPVNACTPYRKCSLQALPANELICDCEENSYYCSKMKIFLRQMKEQYPMLDFAQMTRSYLASLEVCRTAIDAEELIRADAEKTLNFHYLPSKRPHFNIESIMQWNQRLKNGPHPSVFAYEYNDIFGSTVSFVVESTKPNEQLSLPNIYHTIGQPQDSRMNGHHHHHHQRHKNMNYHYQQNQHHVQMHTPQHQQQEYYYPQQVYYVPVESIQPRLSYSSVVTGATPTPTGSKLSEDGKGIGQEDHFVFDENMPPIELQEMIEERETPLKPMLYAEIVAKAMRSPSEKEKEPKSPEINQNNKLLCNNEQLKE